MALAIDNTTSTIAFSASSATLSHTCSGSNRLLVVSVMMIPTGGGAGIHDIQFNGVSLSQQLALSNQVGSFVSSMGIMIAPPTGANNVVVTIGSGVPISIIVSATSYTGADQITGIGGISKASDLSGTGTAITTNVATTSDNSMILDALLYASNLTTGQPTSSGLQSVQTLQSNTVQTPFYTGASSNRTSPVAGNYGMTWQRNPSDTNSQYVHTCVEILPVSTSTGASALVPYTSTVVNNIGSTITFPHTVGTGTGSVMTLAFSAQFGVLSNSTGVTFNGVDMTQVIRTAAGGGDTAFSYIYVLPNPTVGTHTVSITMATSGPVSGSAVSFFGGIPLNPIGATNSQFNNSYFGTNYSLSTTTQRGGSYLLDSIIAGVSSPTPQGNQIQIHNYGQSHGVLADTSASSILQTTTAGSYSTGWNGTFGGALAYTVAEVLSGASSGGNGAFLINFL